MIARNNIFTIDYNSPDIEIVKQAAAVITSGGIIAAPTETRYGLLTRADDKASLDNLYNLKKRPAQMPMAVFVNSIEQMKELAILTKTAGKLAEKFLPGSLTLVLKAKKEMPAHIISDGKIGIRYSPAPFLELLLEEINFPITATSANLSGNFDCKTIGEIEECFKTDIDMYINTGILDNKASTVIDLTVEGYNILRHGAITETMIKQALEESASDV